jgi:gas vesicle protein
MKTASIVAFAAIGVTVGLLFTTKKGAAIREQIADTAGEWKDKVGRLSRSTVNELSDLKDVVSREVKGLGTDARRRILDILNESADSNKAIRAKVKSEIA